MPSSGDEFGFDSSDEAELAALAVVPDNKRKRAPSAEGPQKKWSLQSARRTGLALSSLTNVFGHKGFRLEQEQAIERLVSGKSAVVVFPTGGGKSLVFQIPALIFPELDVIDGTRAAGEHGITLVVSPLIALMKDQCDALTRRGIKAATMDSSKTREEYLRTCDMLRNGELRLLYCAPERLNNEGFVSQMQNVKGGIRLLAVDEAHCISEWGHAFRPDYLKIARFAKEIRAERIVCLTATATDRVAKDVCKAFDIPDDGLIKTTTYRPNLHLFAASGQTKKELYPELFRFLRRNKGSSIVYVTLQKQSEALASTLHAQGFNAKAFHAGLPTPTKTRLQDEFMRSENMIMIATIAFGMGIDKASIRNVVHFSIPSSLESYSQEIGRAGRDGKTSNCMLYLCGEDLHLRETFARGDLPSKDSIRRLLEEICDQETCALPLGSSFRTNHYTQERAYDIRSTTLKNIYAQLELTHGLIRATTPVYTKYPFTAGADYASIVARDTTPAGMAIKKNATKKSKWYHLDPDEASERSGVARSEIVGKLKDLDESGMIELKPASVLNVYKIMGDLPKTAGEIESLSSILYSVMVEREKEALGRTDEMLNLVTGDQCFSLALASHFGDVLVDGKKACGHCTWCTTEKAVELRLPPPVSFNWEAFRRVLAAVPNRDDPRLLARIAFGISSPACTALKISTSPVMGSMDDHPFEDLLVEFTKECNKNQTG